jgi:hypothetical protein
MTTSRFVFRCGRYFCADDPEWQSFSLLRRSKKKVARLMVGPRRALCAYRLASPQPLKPRPLQQPLLMHSACSRTQTVEPQLGWPPKPTQATAHLLRMIEQLIPLPPGLGCPPSR